MGRATAIRCAGIAGRIWRCRAATRHPSGLCRWHRVTAKLAPRSCAVCGTASGATTRAARRPLQGCTVCGAKDGHMHVMQVDRTGCVIHQEPRCGAHACSPLSRHAKTGTGELSASVSIPASEG